MDIRTRHGAEAEAFLVVHRGALGDWVATFPALSALRRRYPGAVFAGVGAPERMRMAARLGYLDAIHGMESAWLLPFFQGEELPPPLGRPAGAALWLADGERPAALLRPHARWPVALIAPFPPKGRHVARHHLDAVCEAFGLPAEERPASLLLPPPLPRDGRRGGPGRVAVFHPGSGGTAKNLPPGVFLKAAAYAQAAMGVRPVFILGPAEDALAASGAFPRDAVVRPESLDALVDILLDAAFFIGNDSGPAHLAAALAVPTLALFKATDPAEWAPTGLHAVAAAASGEDDAMAHVRRCVGEWLRGRSLFLSHPSSR